MKRVLIFVVMAFLLAAVPLTHVLASDISDALYRATIRVNNSSYTATDVSVPFTLSTQALISGYYVDPDFSNIAIRNTDGGDVPFMPAQGAGTYWPIFVDQISQNSSTNYYLYAGGGDMESTVYYFPADDGMTADDSASLELGGNFEIEMSGYIDTAGGSDKNLIYKEEAFIVFANDAGVIRAGTIATGYTLTLHPSGEGDETNIEGVTGAATHWEAVSDGSTDSYVTDRHTTYDRDLYICEDPDGVLSINSVTVYFKICNANASYIAYAKPEFKIGGTVYTGNEQTQTGTSWSLKSQEYTTSPATSGAWTIDEITNMQLGLSLKSNNTSYVAKCCDLYIEVDCTYQSKYVEATGIDSGDMVIKVAADGTNMKLYIDSVEEDSIALSGATVADNSNGWVFLENGVMPYMDYLKITISDVLQQHIEWENSTTFTDLSGNGHDTTPTFRTTSSDPDVTATILSFGAINNAEMAGYGESEVTEVFTEVPEVPSMHEELNVGGLPGADLINELLDNAGIPRSLFWFPIMFGLAIVAGMITFYFSKDALIMSFASLGVLIFFAAFGAVPLWTLVPYIAVVLAVLASRKTVSL